MALFMIVIFCCLFQQGMLEQYVRNSGNAETCVILGSCHRIAEYSGFDASLS